MPATVKLKKVASGMWHIYGASGCPIGWIERSYLKSKPWRLSLSGQVPLDYAYLSEAREAAITQGFHR